MGDEDAANLRGFLSKLPRDSEAPIRLRNVTFHCSVGELLALVDDALAYRAAGTVAKPASINCSWSGEPDHGLPMNQAQRDFTAGYIRHSLGGESTTGTGRTMTARKLATDELAEMVVVDGQRWNPTADYRMHPDDKTPLRAWRCVDVPGCRIVWIDANFTMGDT